MTVETPTLLDNGGCPALKVFPAGPLGGGRGKHDLTGQVLRRRNKANPPTSKPTVPTLAGENGNPVDDFSVSCDRRGNNCGFYTYVQGTSMASPHVAGLAAVVIEEHGHRQGRSGYSLDPDTVSSIIENTATDRACPAGGVEIYRDEGRPAEFNAICEGTTDDNGLNGEGIVNAAAAVARQ
jgi:subtilisin family serine protease